MGLKTNISIMDTSLSFAGFEPLFRGLKDAGADGLEIVVGVKSRWSAAQLLRLSEKYELPINTLHQPIWSGVGWWLDEGFVRLAKDLKVNGITVHPHTFASFDSRTGRAYLEMLAKWQEKYHIPMFLENPQDGWTRQFMNKIIDRPAYPPEVVYEAAKTYGFMINYDTSHAHIVQPQNDMQFKELFPRLGNIHLSSFTDTEDHLPLYMGDFDTKGFIRYLYKRNYAGQLTFEIFYPSAIQLFRYDFGAIKQSIQLVKSVKP